MRRTRLDAEVDEIVVLFRAGVTAEEIARLYHITARAVRYRLAGRGCHYRRAARADLRLAGEMRRGEIHRLRGQGLPLEQMAAHLGLHVVSLRIWMQRNMPALYAQMKAERRAKRPRPSPVPESRPALRRRKARRRPRCAPQGARLRRDYLAGYSIGALARHYRAHPWTVWRVLRLLGVSLRPRTQRSPRWLEAFQQARAERNSR